MKKIHYISIMLVLGTLLYSCKDDYLDVKNIPADIPVDKLYSNYSYIQQVVWNTYSYLPDGFDKLLMEGATDNAESTSDAAVSQAFNYGIWNQYNNNDDVWNHHFNGIRQANLYLKNKDKADISYIRDRITTSDSTAYFNARNNLKFMEGEVLFIKAFLYFDLLKRYGGVPIFEEPLDFNNPDSWKNVKRNSVEECIRYIAGLCDKAAAIIPADLSGYAWYEDGRVTKGAALALKSRLLLYGASALYRESGSTVTWEEAAKAANDVIALGTYSLDPSYAKLFGANNTETKELIFYRRYSSQNTVEAKNFPIAYEKSNGNSVTPSQNFVDEFEVIEKDGSGAVTGSVPFDWNNAAHAANPYQNRDPRFAATVVYNGSNFKSAPVETFTGGSSGLPKQNASKTGYYLSKWVNQSVDLINDTKSNHTWIYIRYGEILLNYAEAMFNAYGATGNPRGYSMTALEALNLVRQRAGMPALTASQLNQQRIEHERNVELGFEDQRFWDVRRWKKGSTYFKAPLKRIEISKTGSSFTYTVKKLEDRVYEEKMNWYPIPQSEITKTGWAQNANW